MLPGSRASWLDQVVPPSNRQVRRRAAVSGGVGNESLLHYPGRYVTRVKLSCKVGVDDHDGQLLTAAPPL